MITNIQEMIDAISKVGIEEDMEVKVIVNGDEEVDYQIVSIEGDGSGNVVVTVL